MALDEASFLCSQCIELLGFAVTTGLSQHAMPRMIVDASCIMYTFGSDARVLLMYVCTPLAWIWCAWCYVRLILSSLSSRVAHQLHYVKLA